MNKLYLLRIELLDIDPPIWREFVVPCDISLDRLHDVIQIVMGWMESHLYIYDINNKKYSDLNNIGFEDSIINCCDKRLNEFMKRKGQKILYTYDFGDNWEHEITLLNSNYKYKNGYPYKLNCIDGERACPPEDVGGVYGYQEFLEIIDNPGHIQFEEMNDWYGDDFDSEEFEVDYIIYELIRYYNHARYRELKWSEDE